MRFEKITHQSKNFNDVWKIYESSFPDNERRPIEVQKEVLGNVAYNFMAVLDESRLIGLIAFWDLKCFTFIDTSVLKRISGEEV